MYSTIPSRKENGKRHYTTEYLRRKCKFKLRKWNYDEFSSLSLLFCHCCCGIVIIGMSVGYGTVLFHHCCCWRWWYLSSSSFCCWTVVLHHLAHINESIRNNGVKNFNSILFCRDQQNYEFNCFNYSYQSISFHTI